jgi:hypothetical protein
MAEQSHGDRIPCFYGNVSYRAIKSILTQALDLEPLPQTMAQQTLWAEAPRFARSPRTLEDFDFHFCERAPHSLTPSAPSDSCQLRLRAAVTGSSSAPVAIADANSQSAGVAMEGVGTAAPSARELHAASV